LGALHVQVVYLIAFDGLVAAIFSVFGMLVIQVLVTLSEFLDHKLLELNDVDDIKHGLHVVEDHYAQLTCNATVAIVTNDQQHCSHNLTAHALGQIVLHVNWFVMLNCLDMLFWHPPSTHG